MTIVDWLGYEILAFMVGVGITLVICAPFLAYGLYEGLRDDAKERRGSAT